MNWKEMYKSKLCTAEEALKAVKSNQRVVIAHACGEPQPLVDALVNQAQRLENVEIVHMVAMGEALYCQPGMEKHFRHNALFVGGSTRQAVHEGRADYTPCFFHEIPRLFRQGYLPVDVALIQVTPPDKHGYCSFGISVDYTKPAAGVAKVVIAQVNERMPRTLGDTFVHVSDLDFIVEDTRPLLELPRPKISDIEERIGYHIAQLVEDGSTLQLGIGAIPDAALKFLKDKKNLGIHTEMFSDGVMELVEEGVINNKAKTYHPGKIVSNFLMGTQKLYDFVHDNPIIEIYPVDYTNDPYVIARNPQMVSINSALEIDLTGQVCADTIGSRQYSGVGGQVDFVRGASRSAGGKSIIAMPATAQGGKTSKIVARLAEGAAVTTSRNEVHYIATEYGVVDLRGKSLRERAQALISIAHPDFRPMLREQAK
ncbi:MAG: acetyl-CoA hydrolase/transferase C-terminal domain-containing protein [Clostridia bacterium]|jgi:4-hydroxybutyrate CoA-transferase|nr:acetyl-CoA hydrolase/transferase C-terminal domain-containing protein [Clostridia bacterium]